ncbi:prosaposin-like isoform X2 [Oncorhynchus nerka]|uniref:prosaposin-like isoform X2 n=1 Tax=Oncorhynchus nerka TaxID=8023 RepID=UPI001131AB62|nr:prosaposin-like isoform X2 [Oncorhynchus nerka]
MMASFKLALVVFISYQTTALARVVGGEGTQNAWDKLKKGDSCQDCTQIIELLKDLISNPDIQTEIRGELEKLCDLMPGPASPKLCREQVDKNLPLVITFLTSFFKPAEVCTVLGLCGSQSDSQQQSLLTDHIQAGLKSAMTMTKVQFSPECTFCIYLIKSLESMLPKIRTEMAVIDLLGKVCGILPMSYRKQCENLIEKYGKMLMDMLLTYATPEVICTLVEACHGMDTPVLESAPLSDCDSCLTLAVLTHLQLGSNASEPQTSSFLASVCQLHPKALPKCDGFTQLHGHQLKGVLGKPESALDVCERVGLCGGVIEAGEQGGDPCTLGTSYSCSDLKTALECGMVSICQKFAWK